MEHALYRQPEFHNRYALPVKGESKPRIYGQFSEILKDFESGVYAFDNYRKNIVTTIAYLIGVSDDILTNEKLFVLEGYKKLKENEDATIIRYLCKLRTQFLKNYGTIKHAINNDMKSLEELEEYIDVQGILYLRERKIEVNVPNRNNPSVNIAYLNQYILDNIDKIKSIIPEWVEFKYIKSLFLMPNAYSGHNGILLKRGYDKIYNTIFNVGIDYKNDREFYPFRMYISWPRNLTKDDGNVLYNDYKFLRMLYAARGDRFELKENVIDAKSNTKNDVYEFLNQAVNAVVFVDCENVSPYAFCATILNLDKSALSKIKKIICYNDVNTSTAWDHISEIINIPIEMCKTERLIENKSLVDHSMLTGACKEYFKNDTESIILVSSDSDFWALISGLPEARYLVLNEYKKTSVTILEKLNKNNIKHCYMNDFAQDIIQKFKNDVLYYGLVERIEKFNKNGCFETLDVNELVRDIFYAAEIESEGAQLQKEKDNFINKYLKNGFIIKPLDGEGGYRLKIDIPKKL